MTLSTRDQIIATLSMTIDFVAQNSMTEEQKAGWVKVAGNDLKYLPFDLLYRACEMARGECSFPGQIVPFVKKAVDEEFEARVRMAESRTVAPALPAPRSSRLTYDDWKRSLDPRRKSIEQVNEDRVPAQWKRIAVEQGYLLPAKGSTSEKPLYQYDVLYQRRLGIDV